MMNRALLVCCLLACFGISKVGARNFHFQNNCPYPVWVGSQNNNDFGGQLPQNGGWRLDQGAGNDVDIPDDWRGRLWGRTSCDDSGLCETGDCGNKVECQGAGGKPPATLAEFTLRGDQGQDFYDVSLVDGFNIPMSIVPKDTNCKATECKTNVNDNCPEDLRVVNGDGGTIACMTGCAKYPDREDYCCTGGHNTPETCPAPEYASYFSQSCPTAYSYAYDDLRGTFTCKDTDYDISFC